MNAAVINKKAKFQRVPEACADTNWSRNTLMRVLLYYSKCGISKSIDFKGFLTYSPTKNIP